MVKIDREKYTKHKMTKLDGHNELIMFSHTSLGNFCLDIIVKSDTPGESSSNQTPYQSELLHQNQTDELNCNIIELGTSNLEIVYTY